MDVRLREYSEALQEACGIIEEVQARFRACGSEFSGMTDAEHSEFDRMLGGGASWLHYALLAEEERRSSLR